MKCSKCEKEIDGDCKFCSNCGKHIEEKSELDIEGLAKLCSKVWYVLGYVRAKCTKEELEKYEDSIRKCDQDMFNWYKDVVDHWEKWVKENNEKNKKTNGSKRAGIPKAKRAKIK